MFKILTACLIIICFISQNAFCETVFDNRRDIFMDYVLHEKEHEQEKQEYLDAQIQIDLDIQNVYFDLPQCLDIALQNNYNLKITNNTAQASRWDYNSKRAEFLPDVSGNFRISQVRGTFLLGGVAPDIVREIPIYFSVLTQYNALNNNKIFFETKVKQLYKKQAFKNNEFTKDEVILNTTLKYYNLLSKKLNIEVLRTNLLDREEQLRMTQARYEIGAGEKFDVLRAEAQLQIAKKDLVTELNALRFAQAEIANVMGIDILTPVYPKDTKIKTLKLYDGDEDIENIYNLAMKIRPDISAKAFELKAKRVERNSNWGDYIPRLYLYYQYTQSGLLHDSIKFGDTLALELNVPVGKNLGVKTYANYKMADENLRKATWEFENYKRNIKQNIIQSVYNSSAALEKIEASKKEVEAAQLSLDTSLVRMEIGEATFLDVIEAQATKVAAQQGLISNVIEYNCAQVKLLFDSGLITAGDIIEKYGQE